MSKNKPPVKKSRKEVKPKKVLFPFLVLPLLAVILYANTFNYSYTMDDDVYITQHRSVQKGFAGISEIFSHGSLYGFNQVGGTQPYRPIYLLSFAIEKEIGKNTAASRHVMNMLLYALTSIFLYQLLLLILGADKSALAFLVTALFIVHPIHTEVVASIKSRDEILCFLFAVLSLINLFRFNAQGKLKYMALYGFFFFLCLLSKENGVTIAAIAPLSLFFFTDSKPRKIFFQSLPYFLLLIVFLLIRKSVMTGQSDGSENQVINNILNAAHGFNERYATTFVILGKYLLLLLVPYPLSYDYSFNQIPVTNWSSTEALISLLIYTALAAYAVIRFRKKDALAWCILYYFITLSVVSNFLFLTGSTMAERFLYMPSLGFCFGITLLLAKLLKNESFSSFSKMKPAFYLSMTAIAVVFFALTLNAKGAWENNFTLFQAGVKAAPNSARTHGSLAYECKVRALKEQNPAARQELFQRAIEEFRKAADILPGYEYALYNLGVQYYEMGDENNALKTYLETLKYFPNHINANNNVGVIYFNRKQYDNALIYFQKAAATDPNNTNAIGNIGAIYHNKGDLQKAKEYYERAIALSPNANIYLNLSQIYYKTGDADKGKLYETKGNELRQSQ
jgi:tetratricopeptide (TPR) repeat protein